jgi:hypothetical protein
MRSFTLFHIFYASNRYLKFLLLSFIFFFNYTTVNAQKYTESFNIAPPFTTYPGVPSWNQTATITLGGIAYELVNGGNGGWAHQTTGGFSNTANLLYSTAATTGVTIQRKDKAEFQFYGVWLKYTNVNNSAYLPPYLSVTYNGSTLPMETYAKNTTVVLDKNVRVTSVTLFFSGLLNLNLDNVIVGPALAPLPVTYSSVKAYRLNSGIQVNWNVATESGVDHYEIEKSPDGQQFVNVKSISPKNNSYSAANYLWFDANVSGENHYYRIKAVFNTGSSTYSRVVNAGIAKNNESISVHPNPVRGNTINLQINNQPKGIYLISLYNNSGQQLFHKTFEHTGGSASQALDINNSFIKGIYQLKVSGPSRIYTQKVVKN